MSPLLAQFPNNNANNGPPPEFWIAFIAVMGVILVISLIIGIFFLLTLSKALTRCSPRSRTMEPGQVWLNLIPLFNLVWQFITVNRIAESLENEYYDRGWGRGGEDYGRSVGTTYCVMNLLSWVPYCGGLFGLVGLVCFILYWVKIAGYSGRLATASGDYDDFDDHDDRPRRRRDDYDDRRDDYDDRREDRPWDRGGR
ncbi:MAG: hypothetical protein J0I06_00595 [Planctomycetes bacterium]|nr:hypothetical protein [Planctomycetota bacterium]